MRRVLANKKTSSSKNVLQIRNLILSFSCAGLVSCACGACRIGCSVAEWKTGIPLGLVCGIVL